MKYTLKKFVVGYGSQKYRDNWERMFGKKEEEECPCKKDPTSCPCKKEDSDQQEEDCDED